MAIGMTLLIVVVLAVAIWVIVEIERVRHKFYAIMLITLLLFFYITGTYSLKGHDVNFSTFSGLEKAIGVYFSFLGNLLGNLKILTSNAVQLDWKGNETLGG